MFLFYYYCDQGLPTLPQMSDVMLIFLWSCSQFKILDVRVLTTLTFAHASTQTYTHKQTVRPKYLYVRQQCVFRWSLLECKSLAFYTNKGLGLTFKGLWGRCGAAGTLNGQMPIRTHGPTCFNLRSFPDITPHLSLPLICLVTRSQKAPKCTCTLKHQCFGGTANKKRRK